VFYLLSIILFANGCTKNDSTDFKYIVLASFAFTCAGLCKETGLTAIGITTLWSAIPLVQALFGEQSSSRKGKVREVFRDDIGGVDSDGGDGGRGGRGSDA
jgi:hypothetical protein